MKQWLFFLTDKGGLGFQDAYTGWVGIIRNNRGMFSNQSNEYLNKKA